MAWYCAACGKEVSMGQAVFVREDRRVDPAGRPHHPDCVPGGRAAAPERPAQAAAAGTTVQCAEGRLICRRLGPRGEVQGWLELPVSLKQPLMALVADAARGRERGEFPVPGGDKLIVSRVVDRGAKAELQLRREPVGFPPQGRQLSVDSADVERFLAQCRGV